VGGVTKPDFYPAQAVFPLHTTPTPPGSATASLNAAAASCLAPLLATPTAYAATIHNCGGVRVIDCGVATTGSNDLGLLMAQAALGDRGTPRLLAPGAASRLQDHWPTCPWPVVDVSSEDPVAACLAAQYAGWKVDANGFFAMASGPMRAAIGREDLYDTIGRREQPESVVGLLEAASLPPAAVCAELAAQAGVFPSGVLLLIAPTASPAGTLQVVARALETALHQLFEQRFDLERIVRGNAAAPLPPVGPDDLTAIGRTNDAILYGGVVRLEVRGDDASLEVIGPRIVSSHSPAHGRPFIDLFRAAGGDFYALDPSLFAPAVVELTNLDTGRSHRWGHLEPAVVASSFGVD